MATREELDVDATEGPDHQRASIVTFGTEVFDAEELDGTERARPWRVARVEASGVVELSRAAVEVRGVKSIDTDTREVSIDALRSFHDGTGRFRLESAPKEPPARRRRGRPAKTEAAPAFEASESGEDRVHALVTFEMAGFEWEALLRGLRAWDPTKTPTACGIRGASNQPLELRYAPAGSPDVATLVERLREAGAPFLDLGEVPRRAVFDKAPSNRAVREAWNAAHPDDRVSIPTRAIEREPVTEETLAAGVSP